MHLSLHHHPSYSLVSIDGSLTAASIDSAIDMFSMVPVGQPLVIDLAQLTSIESVAAVALHDELRGRALDAAVAVVVNDLDVSMQLVLHDVDRRAQFVRSRADALALVTGVLAGRS